MRAQRSPVLGSLIIGGVLAAAVVPATGPAAQVPVPAPARPASYTITGTVTDSARVPLAGVEVRLVVAGTPAASTQTAADGRFSLRTEATGLTVLALRRAGYSPRDITVRAVADRGQEALDVVLSAEPAVTASASPEDSAELSPRIAGFRARRAIGRGGYFLEDSELRKKRVQRLSEAIRGVPGVTLVASGRIGNAVRFRNCQPMVWVDGVRTPDAELDETVSIDDVGGLEVYVSPGGVPAQFRDLQNPCGAILVWTR
jgi:hypothetical protein